MMYNLREQGTRRARSGTPLAPREPWSLDGAAGPPEIPAIPGSAVSPALVSRCSWCAGPVPAPLWKDRNPIYPKMCWNRSGTPQTATSQRRRNRAPGDPRGSGGAGQAPYGSGETRCCPLTARARPLHRTSGLARRRGAAGRRARGASSSPLSCTLCTVVPRFSVLPTSPLPGPLHRCVVAIAVVVEATDRRRSRFTAVSHASAPETEVGQFECTSLGPAGRGEAPVAHRRFFLRNRSGAKLHGCAQSHTGTYGVARRCSVAQRRTGSCRDARESHGSTRRPAPDRPAQPAQPFQPSSHAIKTDRCSREQWEHWFLWATAPPSPAPRGITDQQQRRPLLNQRSPGVTGQARATPVPCPRHARATQAKKCLYPAPRPRHARATPAPVSCDPWAAMQLRSVGRTARRCSAPTLATGAVQKKILPGSHRRLVLETAMQTRASRSDIPNTREPPGAGPRHTSASAPGAFEPGPQRISGIPGNDVLSARSGHRLWQAGPAPAPQKDRCPVFPDFQRAPPGLHRPRPDRGAAAARGRGEVDGCCAVLCTPLLNRSVPRRRLRPHPRYDLGRRWSKEPPSKQTAHSGGGWWWWGGGAKRSNDHKKPGLLGL
eukprot:gene11091-biopygen9387